MAAVLNNESHAETYEYDYFSTIEKDITVFSAHVFVIAVIGTVLNLWFLIALLSSSTVRSRLRNKIICNSFVLHLVDSLIILPVGTIYNFLGLNFNCLSQIVFDHLVLMHDLAANWMLVMLLSVFLAQIKDFNPSTRLSSGITKLGTGALLAIPWIASLIIVPVIIHEYKKYFTYEFEHCFSHTPDTIEVFRSIDTAVPIFLVIILVLIAAYLRYRRFNLRNTTSSMQVELIGRGPEIDNICVYVTAVAVSSVCDLPRWILKLNVYALEYGKIYPMLYCMLVMEFLAMLRSILMPITWLLLPDIRQRIKTWRPWHRSLPGIDLTVIYTTEQTTEEVQ